jgi:uncharacterized membrane protein YhfC
MVCKTKPSEQQWALACFERLIKFGDMSVLRQLGEYLYIKKKDPNRENTQWMKYMHGINRISILLFLFALVVMLVRAFVKK